MSSNTTTTPADDENVLPLSTCDVKQEVKVRMGMTGGQAAIPPKTIIEHFHTVLKEHGNKPSLYQKLNSKDKEYKCWTWNEYYTEVTNFAKALLSLDFQRFDIINIIGFNSPEWLFSNFGTIFAGGISAGIYTTNNEDACLYISQHSKAKVIVCENRIQLQKFMNISDQLPELKALVMYGTDELPTADMIETQCPNVPIYTFSDFMKLGGDIITNEQIQERSSLWKPGETCTLIYTSGTTGPPKAAMITHDNITWTVRTMLLNHPNKQMLPTDRTISYLPLSHIAAQILDMHMPMCSGCQVYFAQPDALKGSIATTLKEVRPTAFFGVPRVWEKFYDKLQEIGAQTTGIKKKLSTFSKGMLLTYWGNQQYGRKPIEPCMLGFGRYIMKKVHVALGLDQCIAFYVSAAPISTEILWYFASINIPIMEIFGQSECTGPHSINKPAGGFKMGTVGRPMMGTETKIDDETGELCYRGRHIFAGYMGMADKTAETIDDDGWLHSGDIAAIDDDHDPEVSKPSGFIRITGRIKELIITAGGENVPPVLIEDEIKASIPEISNAMVIGDKRKFLTAVLCLQVEVDIDTGIPSNKLTGLALSKSKELGSEATTTEEVMNDEIWKEYIDSGIQIANGRATSRAQKIGKWSLLPTDFSEKGTELTPTLKLKRSVTAAKYSDIIEAMYA